MPDPAQTRDSATRIAVEPAPTMADVKKRFAARLPLGSPHKALAEAWEKAVLQQAIEANVVSSPPPTTLAGLRADLLMHVCKQLKRLVTERETEVMLRVSPTTARAIHRQMKATYEDLLYEYLLTWAMRGAKVTGTGKYDNVRGDIVVFDGKDALDAAIAELTRGGKQFARRRDDENNPHKLYVAKDVNIQQYLPAATADDTK